MANSKHGDSTATKANSERCPVANVGMATIHHTDSSATVKGALEEAFELSLR
jgi:hypothetical protein